MKGNNDMSKFIEELVHKYTYFDYVTWPADNPIELIDGVPYSMTTAPSRIHQKISGELFRQISNYLQGKTCEVYASPFDVRLTENNDEADEEINNVIQPDISIICDMEKLDDKGCKGTPDLVMEIVSPSSISMDYIKKLYLYEKYSVREYWIIHPIDKIIMVYKLVENGKYARPEVYQIDELIRIGLFEDLTIFLADVFGG
jgi:Uma2 family endonuclease